MTVGVSVHSVEDAREAELLGASYLTAGHIYTTDCKKAFRQEDLLFSVKYAELFPFRSMQSEELD